MLSLSSYSQTDTTKTVVSDTTKVILPTSIAIKVYQDLLRYDGLKLENVELKKVIGFMEDKDELNKKKNLLQEQKIGNLELIITKKDEQVNLYDNMTKDLQKELKGQRRKTFLYKVGTFAGIIMTSLYLLK